MKKSLLLFIILFFSLTLLAEKIYRDDGSFFTVQKEKGVFAKIVSPISLRNYKNPVYSGILKEKYY